MKFVFEMAGLNPRTIRLDLGGTPDMNLNQEFFEGILPLRYWQ